MMSSRHNIEAATMVLRDQYRHLTEMDDSEAMAVLTGETESERYAREHGEAMPKNMVPFEGGPYDPRSKETIQALRRQRDLGWLANFRQNRPLLSYAGK